MAYRKDPHHPAIAGLVEALEQRRLDRREFLRTVTLLTEGSQAFVAGGYPTAIVEGNVLHVDAQCAMPSKRPRRPSACASCARTSVAISSASRTARP